MCFEWLLCEVLLAVFLHLLHERQRIKRHQTRSRDNDADDDDDDGEGDYDDGA